MQTTSSGCEDKLPSLIAPEDDSNSADDIPLTSTALTCEEGKTGMIIVTFVVKGIIGASQSLEGK